MNPNLLILALTAPLDQLVELPNAVRIASSAREDLQRFSADQVREKLVQIDTLIRHRVVDQHRVYGHSLIRREDQRDLDWYVEAITDAEHPLQSKLSSFHIRDGFRILSLYKLGEVIHATEETPQVVLINPLVSTLMESLEAMLLADLLPELPLVEQSVETAWRTGLTPDLDALIAAKKVKSEAARHAADIRHAPNRAAREKALELYASQIYRTQEEAYRIIGAQVCRAPGTVKNWVLAANKLGNLNQ